MEKNIYVETCTKPVLWDGNYDRDRKQRLYERFRAGSHFDISISISTSLNVSIRKISVNRGYITITTSISITSTSFQKV